MYTACSTKTCTKLILYVSKEKAAGPESKITVEKASTPPNLHPTPQPDLQICLYQFHKVMYSFFVGFF